MFTAADFYKYCSDNCIDVMPYFGMPYAAATIRDGKWYCVSLDFSQIKTIKDLNTILLHESGHLRTGALHKVDSPYQLVAQAEYRANADSFDHFLPPEEIVFAMKRGYTEPWQLSEWFNISEDYINKALHYWKECKGVDFNLV